MTNKYTIQDTFYDNNYIDKYFTDNNNRLKRLVNLVSLKDNYSVADFACGNGLLADLIHNQVKEYVGVDYSASFINRALQRHFDNVDFYCRDIVEFCNDNKEAFHVGFALDFAEHLTDEELLKVFGAIRHSLRAGGKLYMHTPNGSYFLEIMKKVGVLQQLPGHISVRTADAYIRLLTRLGYSNVVVKRLSHYLPLPSWGHPLSYLPVVGDFFAARLFIVCEK